MKTVKLEEVTLSITDGKHGDCEPDDGSGYYFISCKDVRDGLIDYSNARQITVDSFSEAHKRTRLEPNDILLTNSGTIGRMALVKDIPETRRTTFQKSVAIIKPDTKKVDPSYLYYNLQSCVTDFVNQSNGSAQKNLLLGTMRNFVLEIPEDIPAQKRIASILSAYDSIIENNQKQIKLLEEAAQRLYKEWFVDLRFPGHENTPIIDGVPEGWERKKLIGIADVQYGFAFNGSLFNSIGIGMPIIRIRNIPDGFTSDYTSETADDQYIVKNGEIVVGMDGEFHINSWNGDDAYLVQRTCRIRPHEQIMNGWLLSAVYSPIKFFEKTLVGATVAHLGKKHIDTITLLVAPNDSFYTPFSLFFNKRQKLLNQNRRLANARDRLLPKLMSGVLPIRFL